MIRLPSAAMTASIAMTALAGTILACSRGAGAGAAGDAKFVRISGTGTASSKVRLTWGPDSGSLTTEHAGGATEHVWFNKHAIIRSGVSGDVYRRDGPPDPTAQAERLLLTGNYRTMHVVGRAVDGPQRITTYSAPHVMPIDIVSTQRGESVTGARIAMLLFGDFRFDGPYITRWAASGGVRFEANTPPTAVDRFDPEPKSAWSRARQSGRLIDATVDGVRARVVVDTRTEGLSVSPSFAEKVGAQPAGDTPVRLAAGFAAEIMDVEAPIRLVKLRRVTIAGKFVDPVFASVADDDRFDLRAGIGLFPNVSISLTRDAAARLTNEPCIRGIRYNPWDGRVIAYEPGRISHATLLDTAHPGRPLRRSFGPSMIRERASERCDSRRSTITFGGRMFGRDFVCNRAGGGLQPIWDSVIGLHSLRSNHLVIDTRRNSVCWS